MGLLNGNSSRADSEIPSVVPKHVAIIMDGNGRWAKSRFFPRIEGHRQGVKAVRQAVEESRRWGVRYLTLFAFSTENWSRPVDEVSSLMKLFLQYLESEVEQLKKNDIRLRAVGELTKLPTPVREALGRCMKSTEDCSSLDLILAISYGGREEIVSATKKVAERVARGEISPADIDQTLLRKEFYAPDIPDVDLLIRTSDENRISNFLLWQLAYAEIVVTPVLWPDFSSAEYLRCIKEFASRERRFGLTQEQIELRAEQAALRE